jgi:hypothetical protein
MTITLTTGQRYTATASAEHVPTWATCGACGLRWDDGLSTDVTPTPSGRCPNEYDHDPRGAARVSTWADGFGTWHCQVSVTARAGLAIAQDVAVAAIAAEIAERAPRDAAPHTPIVKVAERTARRAGRLVVHFIEIDAA